MTSYIEILGTGRLDERNSAYPQAVQLPNGDILCSYCVGDGPRATEGTDWSLSRDGGYTWTHGGTILAPTAGSNLRNHLKLSLSADRKTLYAYGSQHDRKPGQVFGEFFSEPVFCTSIDGGSTWSLPRVVPIPRDGNFEIAHGILPLSSGRLLAPAATLPSLDRLGEKVIIGVSDDGGRTWPEHAIVFHDSEGRLGYFENKLAEIGGGRVMAVCWTVTLGTVEDRPNSFALSDDGGSTWGMARSTGINGQTMTPVPLGDDRLLILFNRRYGEQGIVMGLATFTERDWTLLFDGVLYDARTKRKRPEGLDDGAEELKTFEFGFPTALPLKDGTHLVTHWCKEEGRFGIRWTKIRVHW